MPDHPARLSAQELAVVRLLVAGRSVAAIADALGVDCDSVVCTLAAMARRVGAPDSYAPTDDPSDDDPPPEPPPGGADTP